MNNLVEYSQGDGVATLTLNNGKVNAISPELITQLNLALDQAENDRAVVVITGRPGMFSGGYDLSVIAQGEAAANALIQQGSLLTKRLLSFPTPVIASCSGHAIAKGAFILLASDLRIGAAGQFKICLNEVAIGMAVHYAGIELARQRLSTAALNRALLLAEPFDPRGAVDAGFLDMVVPAQDLRETTRNLAHEMTKLNFTAHYKTKMKLRRPLLDALQHAIEEDTVKLDYPAHLAT